MSLENGNNRGAEPLRRGRRLPGLETSKPCDERERLGMTIAPVNATAGSAGIECTRRLLEIRGEISLGGRRRPTTGTSGEPVRPVWSREKSERFIVTMKARNGAGAKGPHLVDVNSEAQDRAMAPAREIATTIKVPALPRTLSRTAKSWHSIARAVNGLGKPDAGNPPVRFDEGRGVHRGTDNCGRFNPLRCTLCLLY